MPEEAVLDLRGLEVSFPGTEGKPVPVVRGISLQARRGRILGLVGESGSGKSMTALAVLGLVPYPGEVRGEVLFRGRNLTGLPEEGYRRVRGGGIAVVFQDPSSALNPVLTIAEQLTETLCLHRRLSKDTALREAVEQLRRVGIPRPEQRIFDYPHQFSGGMKQRVLIAMAMASEPDCLILDEPTTALDVTVQAQILDLIEFMQNAKPTSILLISHDLAVVSEVADSIAIMYAGRIVERAATRDILSRPRHPYTRALLDAVPKLDGAKAPLVTLPGMPPDPAAVPGGCAFQPRCPRARERCTREDPRLPEFGDGCACWYPLEAEA